MMNKLTFKYLMTTAALLGALSASAQTTFKIATVVPDGTAWITTMRAGSDEIEERTEGRVKFKFYTGGVQGNDNQVRRKMRIGQLHGGVFTSGGMRTFQKDSELFGLPLLFENYEEVAYVRSKMDGKIRQLIEDQGFVTFGFAGGGFAYLMSNGPISSRTAMQGLKIWIPEGDEVARRASQTLGIAPVSLPLTDVLTGLQTELLDTVMGPPIGVLVMQWHTVVTHITDLPIAYAYATLLIDGRAFGKISEADQAVVREVMEAIYVGFDKQDIADNQEALAALRADGLQMVTLEPGQPEEWKALIRASNRKVAEEGIFDITLLDELNCYLEAYRAQADDANCAR
jgi:TRAP-type C4-dicarboxylate transport system substrate-binding protein